MSEHVIKMPDLGEGIVEAELVAWRVAPGDAVTEDQVLADVMTDKATVEIPSPVAGTVVALGAGVGSLLRVGSELIRIRREGAEAGAVRPPRVPEPAAPAAASLSPPAGTRATAAPPARTAPTPGSQGPASSAAPAGAGLPSSANGSRPIASPSVRRRAWEAGVDLAAIAPSGTAGRIMHADLDAYLARQPGAPTPPPGAAPPPPMPVSARPAPAVAPDANDEVESVAVIGLRRRIAMQMQEAKRRIPHFAYVEQVDVTDLEALRAELNARHAATRGKLTLLPFVMRAMVRALREFPQINARFDDEKGIVARHRSVHLGVATQTDAGLMVPVVRHAQALDLWATAAEVARLAELARAGRITRGELTGSTITLTSLGPLGGIVTTPIINAPEVAIVGVNRIVEQWVMRGGALVERLMMNLSSSFDHRVVDGMDAARFIQAVRASLEAPATLFID